jgi:prepilin-type N-terminal cleavage/methylation domain-containing protein
MNNIKELMKEKIIKTKKGFTLVEILTVLFIVSLGLVGILSLIVQNIQSQSYNKNNLIAYQLAQEGIELIREVRDSNWKAEASFDTDLASGQYYMDYLDSVPHDASSNPTLLTILKQNDQGFYFHNSLSTATSSGFSRLITIQGTSDYLQIISQVSWIDHSRNYTYDLETMLYDWK